MKQRALEAVKQLRYKPNLIARAFIDAVRATERRPANRASHLAARAFIQSDEALVFLETLGDVPYRMAAFDDLFDRFPKASTVSVEVRPFLFLGAERG